MSSAYTEIVYGLGGQPIAYHNRTDWTDQFFYLGAAPFAKYQGGVTYFIHGNHLGSTNMVFNHTGGTVAQDEIFYPWGERWNYAGTLFDERFASLGRRDPESTLDPTLFRKYSSRLYRWLSPDPVAGSIFNPQSLNRYAYVLNNPTNLTDPLGLQHGGDDWAERIAEHIERVIARIGRLEIRAASLMATGCRMDWMPINCLVAYRAVQAGIAAPCPNNDCTGIRAVQGPGGTTVIQQWVPPEYWSSNSGFVIGVQTGGWKTIGRIPDYYQITFSYNPFLYGLAGFTGTVTVDRYNRVYLTAGVNVTKGLKVGASVTYGWMEGYEGLQPPSPEALSRLFKGGSCSASIGALFVGKSREWSSGGIGYSDPIFMTPQGGISCGYSW